MELRLTKGSHTFLISFYFILFYFILFYFILFRFGSFYVFFILSIHVVFLFLKDKIVGIICKQIRIQKKRKT
jgi:hypothetical protein